MTVASSTAMSLGNHVRIPTVAVPASTYPAVSRTGVVTKTSTTTSQPQPAELLMEGRVVAGVPTSNYEPTHVRVAPAVEDTGVPHRVYIDEQRPVHGEFMGMNMPPRYPNRFLEPPRVDVRLSGSSPSTPSPAGGRPQDSETHPPTHHSALPTGYDVVSSYINYYISYFLFDCFAAIACCHNI